MKIFTSEYLNDLSNRASNNRRQRQHINIHDSYKDACQRLFNSIEPGSYIRPHRHDTDPKDELLIAIRGLMVLVTFDEQGSIIQTVHFGAGTYSHIYAVGVEVPANTWHTVIAMEPGSILLEVKAGPFDPSQPKDLAPWAPDEESAVAQNYLNKLIEGLLV